MSGMGEAIEGPAEGMPDASNLAEENERLRREAQALRAAVSDRRRSRWRSFRGVLAGILVVLTSISILAATVAAWVDNTIWDTDHYVDLVAPLASDPAVTGPLAVRLTDDVFSALDVQGRIEETISQVPRLAANAQLLAGPLAAGARSVVQQQVGDFLASPTFANLWIEMNRQLHTKIVALLEGDYSQLPNVSVTGGQVRLNLVSALAAVMQQLTQSGVNALGINATVPSIPPDLDSSEAVQRLGSALGVTLPEDFGQITIMTQEQLAGYQEAANDLKKLSGGLIALSIVLLILTIVMAPSRRRALIWLGVGVVAAVLLGGVFIRRLEARVVDAIPGAGGQAAARDVFAQVSSSLRTWGWTILAISLVVGVVAYLAGRPPWLGRTAAWVRRISAEAPGGSPLEIWIARRADAVRIGAVAVAVLVLFLTGIAWIPVLLVGVLLAAFLWWVAATKRRIPTSGDPDPVSVPEAEVAPEPGRESVEGGVKRGHG